MRLGTAEFYRVVEELPEVADSLVVHLEDPAGGNGELLLYVQPRPGADLDDALRRRIATALRTELSPRHIPDGIAAVPVVPRNRTGKKLELPVKKILLGAAPDEVASRDVLADPTSLDPFVELAGGRVAPALSTGSGIRRVAVVGTGVIGASWAAHFLAHGLDVVRHRPGARRRGAAAPTSARALAGADPPVARRAARARLHFTPHRRAVRRRRLRAGERARARGPQARPLRGAGRGRPTRRACSPPARRGCCRP